MARPSWYTMIILIACAVISPVASIWVSFRIAENNTRQQIEAQERQRDETRRLAFAATCNLLRSQVGIYEETPPTTLAGKNAYSTWLTIYRQQGCLPAK